MPAIGIDLGTTYCCVATFHNGMLEIIPNEHGNLTTPSYVAFSDGRRLIGEAARDQAALNPRNTIYDAKRLIGRRIDEATVSEDRKNWPFVVVEDEGKAKIKVEFDGQSLLLLPEEVSSMLLAKMKEVAEAYLGQSVTDAIITVPAYFNNMQRQATRDAGLIAGLNVLRVISEPTAAAIAYGLDKKLRSECNVLVYDLGGGTLDVSVMNINENKFVVRSTFGNTHLGGQDFDQNMVNFLVKDIQRKHNVDVRESKSAMHRLRTECERVKRILSAELEATIDVDDIYQGISVKTRMSRAKFEELNAELFRSTLEPVKMALRDAQLNKGDIDEVVLVGGSTRIPMIRKLVKEFFDGKRLNVSINADEAIAHGAALQAANMIGDQSEKLKNLVMKDVTPLSLGTELYDGRMRVVIRRNSPIPITAFKGLQTTQDFQTECTFSVYEGERAMAADNHFLDSFLLTGLQPARRGLVKFDVTFHVDEDGILTVSVAERGTKNCGKIKITKAQGGLTEEDIERMKRDAKRFKAKDVEHNDRILIWNALNSFAYSIKRKVENYKVGCDWNREENKAILAECEKTLQWLEVNRNLTRATYEKKLAELEEICRPVTRSMPQ
ncbi:heat shock 70kDa protein 1/2/6/8 [Paragonimus westermani]|uniref:Heat shock 70kDa protein 1/2/6/8 n=1 Tax=Paragonimus westermani TaxID=34504 RepID=A0A5J4N8W8_9TREM|nr:heat shock 70kDa protein 1/2/6/8 [Paragonimus westermani]